MGPNTESGGVQSGFFRSSYLTKYDDFSFAFSLTALAWRAAAEMGHNVI